MSKLPLDTGRLLLRLFTHDDRRGLYALHRSPLVTRYAGGTKNGAESRQTLTALIRRTSATALGALAVQEKKTGELIGWAGVQYSDALRDFELIYALDAEYWGRGYASEAAIALVQESFSLASPSIDRLLGIVFPQNTRSIALLKRLGMRYKGTYFDSRAGKPACVYQLTKRDFPVSKTG